MSLKSFDRNTLLAILAAPLAVGVWIAGGYLGWMNHEMSRLLLDHQWKTPTEIYSSSRPDGDPVVQLYGADWRAGDPVLLETLPEHVSAAFIAAEDVRFRRHIGIDPIGIIRALVANVRSGEIEQGGSTITQQLIKAMFLSQERTYRRKLIEAVLALSLDARMTKDEILEAYLNEVYLGHQRGREIRGIDEGARLFFGKAPEKLTAAEAALIAAIIPAPNRDTPEKRPEVARERRNRILATMRDRGWLEENQYAEALKSRARFRPDALPETPYRHYLAALRAEIAEHVGERRLEAGGLRIIAEIDPAAQKEAETAIRQGIARLRRDHSWLRREEDDSLQAALLSVDPATGGVRALVGGADPRSGGMDRTSAMQRQPGSAFKTFAYLAAIESRKLTPASLLLDSPLSIEMSSDQTWEPHNYDERFRGRVTLREAFEKSLNVPAVRVAQKIGARSIVKKAEQAGFDGEIRAVPAVPLGVAEVTMRDLVAAYTTFPNLGERVEPFLVSEVRDRDGDLLHKHQSKRVRVTTAPSAYVVHSLLRGVVRRGTANRLKRYGLEHAAGKTGTTSDYRDAWFVGYTSELATAVWVGFDRGAPLRLSSSEAALPIWGTFMSEASSEHAELEPPEGVIFKSIDPQSGYVWDDGCPGPFREVFLSGTAPTRPCPKGFFGRIVRKVLFDDENFDEPAAITFDKFRQWAHEVDQERQKVEGILDRISGIFDDD